MEVKKARKLRDILFSVGIGLILLGSVWKSFWVIGCAVVFSGLIFNFLFNKCPHCDRQLGRNEGDFCQFCGRPLE